MIVFTNLYVRLCKESQYLCDEFFFRIVKFGSPILYIF